LRGIRGIIRRCAASEPPSGAGVFRIQTGLMNRTTDASRHARSVDSSLDRVKRDADPLMALHSREVGAEGAR
jgi:hypothetical protein